MQPNEMPIESRFGETVLEGRRVLRISQKTLAELLSQRNLALDASAISRIEKGTRAIRLNEAAAIADVLGFSLSDVENPRDPEVDFARLRKNFDGVLNTVFDSALSVAESVEELTWIIDRYPELLKQLGDESGRAPTNVTEYVRWVEARWQSTTWIVTTAGVEFESDALRDAVISLIHAVVSPVAEGPKRVEHKQTP